jgi:hypothetical protein
VLIVAYIQIVATNLKELLKMIITLTLDTEKESQETINTIFALLLKKEPEIAKADLPDVGIEVTYDGLFDKVTEVVKICPTTIGFGQYEPTTTIPTNDKNGIAYDDKLHSTPPKLNADGSWRKRKNATPQIAPPPPPYAQTSPIPPPPPAQVPTGGKSEFTKMMLYITPLMESNGGILRNEHLEEFARTAGCVVDGKGQVAMLQFNEARIPLFLNQVNDYVNSAKAI